MVLEDSPTFRFESAIRGTCLRVVRKIAVFSLSLVFLFRKYGNVTFVALIVPT